MENQALNKKLLEFAGFELIYCCDNECRLIGILPPNTKLKPNTYGDFGEKREKSIKPINFTDPEWGIAHCFKWLVPKAIETKMDRDACSEFSSYLLLFSMWIEIGYDALSLCLAIEKLIDAGGK